MEDSDSLQCLCGKVFSVVKSLSAHESQCKAYKTGINDLYLRHHQLAKKHHSDHHHKKRQKSSHWESFPSVPSCNSSPGRSSSPNRHMPRPKLQVAPADLNQGSPPPSESLPGSPGPEPAHEDGDQVLIEVRLLTTDPENCLISIL